MGMGFAPTWLRQVTPPLLHKTTLTTANSQLCYSLYIAILAKFRVQQQCSLTF